MASTSQLGRAATFSAFEFSAGALAGAAIDAIFPEPKADSPLLVEAAEVIGETMLIGVMTASVGMWMGRVLNNDENLTGGFPFFIGVTNGVSGYQVKVQRLIAALKLAGAEYVAGLRAQPAEVPKTEQ